MKQILSILAISISFFNISNAQAVDTLSLDKTEFVKELSSLFNATKRTDLKDLSKEFSNLVKENKINDALMTNIMKNTNKMLLMRGKAYPQLKRMISTYIALNNIPLTSGEWSDFENTLKQVMANSKKGDTKTTLEFMEFCLPLYQKQALFTNKSKTWSLSNENFTLSYGENGPIVSVSNADLKGKTVGDSILIVNTSGTYNYFQTTWYGDKGGVNWERGGLPASEVFASFNEYNINLSTNEYVVDKAILTYNNYFERPIEGKLEDKMVTNITTETARFPRFTALKENVPAQDITENVKYYGGFTLAGSRVLGGSDDEKSELIIYKPNSTEKILTAHTSSITINLPEKISSRNAEISLYFEGDSIYHPSIDLSYDLTKNFIKLVKGEGSLAQSNFTDSYHNIDFSVDLISWYLDDNKLQMNTISTSGIKAATFESNEFFSKDRMRALRGQATYDPLSILNKEVQDLPIKSIYATNYANLISPKLTVKQIQPLLFNLVQESFITYNQKTEEIVIKPKVQHYVLSNAQKKDYDNITIKSNSKSMNAVIDLESKNIDLEGVKTVPISLVNSTLFYPDSQKIVLEKNRNMLFNGLLFCGRVDVFGKKNHFIYDEFKIDLPEIDTLILNIPDGDKEDEYGNPVLRPLNSTLEGLIGRLDINHPNNKSGNFDLPQFPTFESYEKARVHYANKKIRGGTYTKDKFYYEIEPFVMDSLKYIDIPNIKFEGTLYSANIFPNINEPLRVQSDLSLGFHLTSPPEGYELYQGKGKFVSDITLNNDGLSGEGDIEYQTAKFFSNNIQFYPDSMLATASDFTLSQSSGAYESPNATSTGNEVNWQPYEDHMIVHSANDAPFSMYDDRIKLEGNIEITNINVQGAGLADWDDAQLISNNYHFKSQELNADTAELQIKTIDGDKVTFNTPNVNAYVDFKENTGFFKSNTNDNRTEFNYNEYVTTIDEFFWDIDNKRLEFSVPDGAPPAPFISMKLEQDTLLFMATHADYNLETSIIEASGVTEVLVADSRIIPNEGLVTVYPEAVMEPLTNAIIEASRSNLNHTIKNATVKVNGKYDIEGSGDYIYTAEGQEEQLIPLTKIEVILADSSLLEKKKNQKIEHIIHGKGKIDQAQNFIVYPNVQYYGDVDIYSSLEDMKIKGYTKIDFNSNYVQTDFFQVDGKVDPNNLGLTVEGAKGANGQDIRTGIFVNKTGIDPIYTNILNDNIGPQDVALIETQGVLLHDSKTNIYTFGEEEKIESESVMKGNILKFAPEKNEIEAQGNLNFGLDYNVIEERMAGTVKSNLEEDKYTFNTSIAIPIDLDKTIIEKMAYYLFEDNFDMNDVNYENEDLQYQFAELISEKSLEKMQEEVASTGFFEKPKDLKENFVFTDVDMTYDPLERVYRSKGKFGLAFIGDKAIHKEISGYIEFGHRMGSDYMNLYLKTSFNDYVYITFTTTLMEISSSFDDIIGAIQAIDGSKRKIKGDDEVFYIYAPSNEIKARAFIERMKILEKGGTLPPPEPPMEKPKEIIPEEGVETPTEGKSKGKKEEVVDETPNNTGIPQEVLDFENESNKKSKKNNKKNTSEEIIEESTTEEIINENSEEVEIEEPIENTQDNTPQESIEPEENSKKKKKNDSVIDNTEEIIEESNSNIEENTSEEVIDETTEEAPTEQETPKEVLDSEDNSGKKSKKKGKNNEEEADLEEE